MPANLMEYFNKGPRLGVLSTSSNDGQVDSAVFGSPHMIDEKTVLVATAKNRTFANLLENPNAVYIIIERCSDSPNRREHEYGAWKFSHGLEGDQGLYEDEGV